MDKTTLWFILGFVALVAVGLVILGVVSGGVGGSGSGANASSTFVATAVPAITSADWTEGNPAAKVSLIEYGDFECPACGAYYPIVKQVVADFSSTVLFAFRNFPLYSIHPDAGIAAQAAEAAGLQGKYWPMHDMLYTDQTTWSAVTPSSVVAEYFNGYATSLGLNVAQFDTDMNSSKVLNKIQNDVATGNAGEIDHTPTFFVNDLQIPNPDSLAGFEATLAAAVASSTAAQ